MNIAQLLESLYQPGIEIRVEQNNLKIIAPKGVVTPDIQKTNKDRKQKTITYMVNQEADFLNEEGIPQILQ